MNELPPVFDKNLKSDGIAGRVLLQTTRPGNCLDNAVAESFFHTLKKEIFYRRHYRMREEAWLDVFEFIAAFYNRTRLHWTLDYRSPNSLHRSGIKSNRLSCSRISEAKPLQLRLFM